MLKRHSINYYYKFMCTAVHSASTGKRVATLFRTPMCQSQPRMKIKWQTKRSTSSKSINACDTLLRCVAAGRTGPPKSTATRSHALAKSWPCTLFCTLLSEQFGHYPMKKERTQMPNFWSYWPMSRRRAFWNLPILPWRWPRDPNSLAKQFLTVHAQ